MSWIQRYRLRHYVRNSVWILPVIGRVDPPVALFIELSIAAEMPVVGTKPPVRKWGSSHISAAFTSSKICRHSDPGRTGVGAATKTKQQN